MNYWIQQIDKKTLYLICMNYTGILNYLDEIEKESFISSFSGEIVVDQLLVAGNGKNRFISCQFSHGQIDLETTKNIDGIDIYKQITNQVLNEHIDSLKYSILTHNQINQIKNGIVF